MKKLIFLVSTIILLVSLKTNAQTTPKIDNREQNQRTRIHDGVAKGEVTRHEAKRLRTEQRHIKRSERRAKADGTVTPTEKAKIEHKQNRASRDIRRQKHDKQTRAKPE